MNTSLTLLSTFEHDVNVSKKEKSTVFKLLKIVTKNLLSSPEEPKYRQLKTSNPKIQTLTRHPPIVSFLMNQLKFQQTVDAETNEPLLKIPDGVSPETTVLEAAVKATNAAYDRTADIVPSAHKGSTTNSSSTRTNPKILQHQTSSNMSEKQKARILAEQKELKEKEEAKQARKRTAAQIKADKYVRENDPNWKPSVSAAAAKAGDSMSTFRDKFGEG